MSDTLFVDVDGGRLAYDLRGEGPLAVCVPSMGDLRQEYRFLAPALADAGYRVATLDVRGMGETSVSWNDYSVVGIGEDIVALIRHLNSSPAIVIADSMAAGAAVYAAAERPDLIGAMVFFGPIVRGDVGFFQKMLYGSLLADPWGAAFWRKFYASLYPTRKPADLDAYLARLYANLRERGRTAAFRRMAMASKTESERRVSKAKKPALILMGSKDPDFKDPEAEARWLAGELGTSYRMMENAGHYPHAEYPEATAPLVIEFLKTIA